MIQIFHNINSFLNTVCVQKFEPRTFLIGELLLEPISLGAYNIPLNIVGKSSLPGTVGNNGSTRKENSISVHNY
jgi:hypothetical protein